MGVYYPEDNPDGPWCACGCLCSNPVGWCPDCEDWATEFKDRADSCDNTLSETDLKDEYLAFRCWETDAFGWGDWQIFDEHGQATPLLCETADERLQGQ